MIAAKEYEQLVHSFLHLFNQTSSLSQLALRFVKLIFHISELLKVSLLLFDSVLLNFGHFSCGFLLIGLYGFAQLIDTLSKVDTGLIYFLVNLVLVLNELQGVLSIVNWGMLLLFSRFGTEVSIDLQGSFLLH